MAKLRSQNLEVSAQRLFRITYSLSRIFCIVKFYCKNSRCNRFAMTDRLRLAVPYDKNYYRSHEERRLNRGGSSLSRSYRDTGTLRVRTSERELAFAQEMRLAGPTSAGPVSGSSRSVEPAQPRRPGHRLSHGAGLRPRAPPPSLPGFRAPSAHSNTPYGQCETPCP